ncbi:hypothetical protein ACS0TY_000156 [Phlomoides rotata]
MESINSSRSAMVDQFLERFSRSQPAISNVCGDFPPTSLAPVRIGSRSAMVDQLLERFCRSQPTNSNVCGDFPPSSIAPVRIVIGKKLRIETLEMM